MEINVIWASNREDVPCNFFWDMELLNDIFRGDIWRPANGHTFTHHECQMAEWPETDVAIVVLPARSHVDHVDWLNEKLSHIGAVLLCLMGDEEGSFPHTKITHPNIRIWVQTPFPSKHRNIARGLGDGYANGARNILKSFPLDHARGRALKWFFAGQVNNVDRETCVAALSDRQSRYTDGKLSTTKIFGSGMDYHDYLAWMSQAQVVPCPPGNFSADSFRVFEALESGCIPIVGDTAPNNRREKGYWSFLYPTTNPSADDSPPFPVIDDWENLPNIIDEWTAKWDGQSSRVFSWWIQQKRDLVYAIHDTMTELTNSPPSSPDPSSLITILIPTSPTPFHPDTSAIEETIQSIRAHPDLRNAEIILMIDGVREEQRRSHSRKYNDYKRRLCWLANFHHLNVLPVVFPDHQHQANMTRECLKMVRTPYIAFIEHDAPILPDIDWRGICGLLESGYANTIRLHHEAEVLEPHKHLMLDAERVTVCGVPNMRTVQWSQRPHVSTTSWYRWMIDTYFPPTSRTMIEDLIHGVLYNLWTKYGWQGWEKFKLTMYTPEGNIKRSTHSDQRGNDPKFEMKFQ